MSIRPWRAWALSLLLVAAVLAGCSSLPDSGPVVVQAVERPDRPEDAPYFNPPGPAEDGSPAAIVSGFLVAMQANPLSTSVAREFLSEPARDTWQPSRGTIVYEAFAVTPTTVGAKVRLSETRRLDARGGWLGGREGRSELLDIRLVSEGGQWRIDNPVDALAVPTSFFDRSFARFNLYFFDQTGRVLLPDPVFIPRGEQTATNLVRGLLAGPGRRLAEIAGSALPRGTDLDLSVVVTGRGVAEVPLSSEVLQAPPEELSRAVDQIAWTLRQVPGIDRVQISVDGIPVPLPGGRIDAPVTSGAEFDAGGDEGPLLAVRNGRVVDLDAEAEPVPGPLGSPGFSMRSIAATTTPRRLAVVSGDGTTVFVGATDRDTPGPVAAVLKNGTDVLRPSYDMFGELWLVDRTARGARVLVVSEGRVRELSVPGVTGVDVAAASIAWDGSRLAVAYAGGATPRVRVVDVLRTDEGIVSAAGRSLGLSPSGAGRIVDLGWRDPGTLAVLSRPSSETSLVGYLSSDGSPTSTDLPQPDVFRGVATAMAVAPDGNVPLRLVTPDQRLYTLSGGGGWPRTDSRIAAAAYAR